MSFQIGNQRAYIAKQREILGLPALPTTTTIGSFPQTEAFRSTCFAWATEAFRLATNGVRNDTQIHTHMCYCEFGDVMDAISALDADVISLETSRSQLQALDELATAHYANDVGPGVHDIHSPRVPAVDEIVALMKKAMILRPPERLWVNPDCGLKPLAGNHRCAEAHGRRCTAIAQW